MTSNMNWGTELWDQFERVTEHTQKGIEFCERYTHFIKDRARIEADYANALRRLTKSYLPKKKEEESPFTVVKSFNDSLKEVADIAGQHELLVEQLKSKISDEMGKLVLELKTERKKHMDESKRLEAHLQTQMRNLDQAKKRYERSFQEQVRAEETYRNADANLNLSRAEVEKTKTVAHQKAQSCSDCKAGYASVLEQTNSHQRDYYNKHLPQVFQSMQELDEKRIIKIRECIKQMSDVEKGIQPIINTCLDLISQSSEKVDHGEDSRRVIDRFKSGFVPPDDIPFEDLGNEDTKSINSNTKARESTIKPSSSVGTSKTVKKKEKGRLAGLFGGRGSETPSEDFSHLAPQQQKKHLKEKIKSIKHQISKEIGSREGMVKMQDVYQTNPKLGDASSVTQQLDELNQKISSLDAELAKFEGYLQAASGDTPVMPRRGSVGSYHSNNSADISATQSTPSSTGVNGGTPNSLAISQTPHRQAVTAIADSFDHDDSFDEDGNEAEPLPIIGKATALYQFQATTVGSLNMTAEEDFSVVENDNGDGWTRIRKSTGEEGFVPTTYIQLH